MSQDRSGVFVVSKAQGQVVALLCGFFLARSRQEQLAELEDSNLWGEPADKIVERSSRCRVRLHHTPRGIPTMLSRNPRVFPHKKLRAFQDERQVVCDSVPRSWLESLAESEHGLPWLRLSLTQRLGLLDALVDLYTPRS